MAGLQLKNITKSFGKKGFSLQNIELSIADGEFLVLVGPSGCGKSTILNLIAGLEELNTGEILIGDRKVNDLEPKDRNIAMVFQNYALYPHMNVAQNISFGLKLRGFSAQECGDKTRAAAGMLGIEELLSRKPKELSGGQRQRVALGRAIVRDPDIFLFDEPLSNLDAALRRDMRAELIKLHETIGKTMIYVTHDQVEAMTMGDRILVMDNGIIRDMGTPQELYNQPADLFVARFLGSPPMNIFAGKPAQSGDSMQLSIAGKHSVPLPPRVCQKLQQDTEKIFLGIRPEDLSISEEEGCCRIEEEITLIEYMGNEVFAHFAIDGEGFVMRLPAESKVETGSTCKIYLKLDNMHFFEKEGKNILPRK